MKRGNSHRGGLVQLGWMPQKSGGHQAPQKDSGRPLLSPRWEGTFTYGLPVSRFSRIVLGYSPVMQHSVPVYPPRDRGWGGEGEREYEREREREGEREREREYEWRVRRKNIWSQGGEVKTHILQSPYFLFCSVYKEKAFGRKQDYDYL